MDHLPETIGDGAPGPEKTPEELGAPYELYRRQQDNEWAHVRDSGLPGKLYRCANEPITWAEARACLDAMQAADPDDSGTGCFGDDAQDMDTMNEPEQAAVLAERFKAQGLTVPIWVGVGSVPLAVAFCPSADSGAEYPHLAVWDPNDQDYDDNKKLFMYTTSQPITTNMYLGAGDTVLNDNAPSNTSKIKQYGFNR